MSAVGCSIKQQEYYGQGGKFDCDLWIATGYACSGFS